MGLEKHSKAHPRPVGRLFCLLGRPRGPGSVNSAWPGRSSLIPFRLHTHCSYFLIKRGSDNLRLRCRSSKVSWANQTLPGRFRVTLISESPSCSPAHPISRSLKPPSRFADRPRPRYLSPPFFIYYLNFFIFINYLHLLVFSE